MSAVRSAPERNRRLIRKTLIQSCFVALTLLVAGGCGSATRVEPLVAGAQQFFTIDWQRGQRGAQRLVQGHIKNEWGFTATNLRLLVEALDPPDRLISQRFVSLGGQLTPGARTFFEAPVPPAGTYRVRVFAFDWVESPELHPR